VRQLGIDVHDPDQVQLVADDLGMAECSMDDGSDLHTPERRHERVSGTLWLCREQLRGLGWRGDAFSTSPSWDRFRNYDTSNRDLVRTLNPPPPGTGLDESYFHGQAAVVTKNGWFWLPDDWYTRIIGICPSGACT
jgi:hypothetical protein